ncbi:nucleotide sugar dehydrogenase [Tessaracoccus rhinocerotis]|uniref:Nucleotide sugar dehydrogenase n=1 Tax=Tessaracoccus rhinocerotis TaxID=1689449 RepID=A0A553JVR4_9ACTN|nr:nucleotide sugar dehydrogenase [Tessaracoccus rhinocerotis]TRY16557.1 nucleotide sugar dehydrogenase [Tessaracoccus rhinocerotis]
MTDTVTIVGQGYVGLPLAEAASEVGWRVWGLEASSRVVTQLNRGQSHVDDISDQQLERMLGRGYAATLDPSCVSRSQIVVICVPTPLGDAGSPDLSAVTAAVTTIAPHLTSGTTVILESTTYPGTTEEVVLPLLSSGTHLTPNQEFLVAFSPERVNPGDKKFGIRNTPKLVGGLTKEASEAASAFYASFVEQVVVLSGPREAETAKLLENTFRHVNIALVNEMAKFCHELGIDIWEVIRGASTKPFGFMRFTPGPGVGGHCIPIDPNYLSFEVRKELGYPFRFVELAQEINNSMPRYVVDRIVEALNDVGKPLNGSRVLLLGVTYKPDIADQRESPAIPVADILRQKKARVEFYDPYVENWAISDGSLERSRELEAAVLGADIVVLLQAHSSFDVESLSSSAALFLDTQGVSSENVLRL